MKLIKRTNLFLISLVFFQAFLAYNFLTISLVNFSQKEGNKIINNDFKTIKNHYNQFKSQIWKDIVHLDNKLPELVDPARKTNLESILPVLMELTSSEDLDFLIIKRGENVAGINIKNPFTLVPYDKLPFDEGKWHPRLSLESNEESLFLIGSLQIEYEPDSGEYPIIINIIKVINDRFSKDLTYNTSAGIILFSQGKALSGTLDPRYYFKDILNLDSQRSSELDLVHFFDIPFYEKSYNILLSSLDTLSDRETEISIAVFSPNISIKQRFASIKNQFLMISIFCVALAMIISLFISKSISRPVQELGKAMTSLTKGYFPSVKPLKTATEISSLYNDFNSMVERIKYNSSQQIALIQEITFLKTYNEQIVESIQEGIAIIDKTGHLNLMNRAFYDFCPNIKEIEIPHTNEIDFWDEKLEENLNLVKRKDIKNFSYTCRNIEGRLFDIRLYPLRNTGYDRTTENSSVMMLEDITDKEKMASQLLQLEKLNSLSILTAGVAHEINNPLASILSNVENLNIDEDDSDSKTSVQWIKKEIRRIANIIKGLLNFTGSGNNTNNGPSDNTSGQNWISRIDHYMKYILKENGRIIFRNAIEEIDMDMEISDDELLQILINLLNNSVQAIDGEGSIELKSMKKEIERQEYMIIQVIDDGPGIEPEIVNKIFDPFYTTKPVGKGTGLGLSIVYGLMNKYGGSVSIDSLSGEGSTFTLTIPLIKGEQNG